MSTRLLINERPLTVLPSLVKLVGMERAVILQQIHWLLQGRHNGVMHDDEKWVWGTHDEWCADYFSFWQPATLRKHMVWLENKGLLRSMQMGGWNRRKHYRIDYETLDLALQEQDTIEHDRTQCIEHDDTQSIEYDHAASMRDDHAASIRDDHATCTIYTETSTETSTETKGNAPGGAAHFDEFIQEFCLICYGHKETASLTDKDIGSLRREGKKIRAAGFGVADLRAWMTGHWFNDWRWKKDQQRPTPAQVRSGIAILRAVATDGGYDADAARRAEYAAHNDWLPPVPKVQP